MKINIKNSPHLARDTESMAIVNVSRAAVLRDELYKQKLKKEKEVDESISNLKADISSIKNDISKILELLNSRGH